MSDWMAPTTSKSQAFAQARSISSALAAVTVALPGPVLQVPGSEPEPRLELQVRLEAAMKQVWVEQTLVD